MEDHDKTPEQLIAELAQLRRRVAELERASREKEAATGLLLRAAPLGIHQCDAQGRITFADASQERVTGYTADELIGTYIWDRIEPGPQKESLPGYLQRLVSEQPPPTPIVIKNVKKSGELYDIRIDWDYKRNPQGQLTGFVCIVSDVTEQKRAEAALRESERTLRTLIDANPESILLFDLDETILLANRTAVDRLRTAVDQLVGRKPHDFVPADVAARRRRCFEQVVRTRKPLYFEDERQGRCYENALHPVLNEDGSAAAVALFAIDRTERKRAEEALRESEERYRRLAESTTDMIYIVDRAGGILYANSRATAAVRLDAARLIGKQQAELFSQEVAQHHMRKVARVLETGEMVEEDGAYHFGSEAVWLNTRLIALRDKDGQVASVMGVSRDITKRKRVEEALQEARDELEHRVEQRTSELAAANKQLRCEIEERNRIETALRESEERYRALVEASPDAVLMTDLEGNIVFASKRSAEMFGYASAEDLCRQDATVLVVEEERQRLAANIALLPQQGVRQQTEYIGLRRDGTHFVGEVSSAVLCDGRGEPKAFMAVGRDITERKQAEEALQQAHDELRAIYDGMVDGFLMADVETMKFIRANTSICRMTGYSEKELLSMSAEDIHAPAALPVVLETFRALTEGRLHVGEDIPVLRRDGSEFLTDVTANRILYDDRPCVIGFFRDITERKQAEKALAESEAKYRQLVEITDTGYVILDAQGRVMDANAEYVRLSGHHALEEILEQSVVEWTASYDRERNAKEVEKCLEKEDVRQLEIDYVRPDGGATPVEINAGCVDTQQGRRILSLSRDISERRQMQAVLERERQTLKHLLQSSDHERQLIAYEIHDGLAQYLAGALMQLEVYSNLKETKPREARKAYEAGITMLRQGHADARRLISGVRPPILDEEGIVAAISHLVNEHKRQGGLRIEFHAEVKSGRLVPILENAVYRIAQEALMNACKHGKSERIRVELVQHDDRLRIKVQDWGVGFHPGAVADDRFGLAGMRERARLLGGSIAVDSAPGQGTSVVVELPLSLKE
jgi:PAS domain S-box-containing protein